MSTALSQAIVRLFDTERFYAELVCNMQRVSTDSIWLAGVCVKDRVELHINHENFDVLSIDTRVALLKHECEHILRDHLSRARELHPDVYKSEQSTVDNIINSQKHRCLNIAMDMAINGGIKHLPENGVYAKNFDLPEGLTMEAYLELLKNNDKAKDFMDFDGHSLWGESDSDKAIMKEKIKQAVNEAAKKVKGAGQLTAEQELLISELNKSVINWKAILRRFVGRQIDFSVDTSRKKRNRRYGTMYPGVVRDEERLHVGVAIDTSGSVPDEAISQFMSEIARIAKYSKVTVVEADSEIKNVYDFDPKKTYKVKGRGGTAYKPAFDYFDLHRVDAMIYFGDMDCYETKLDKPKYPVLWAIYGDQSPPANFGTCINVTVSKE